MSRSRTSIVWNYFVITNGGDKKAMCNYCNKILSYKSTVTNLKLHLKQKHVTVYKELCCALKGIKRESGSDGSNFGGVVEAMNDDSNESTVALVPGPSSQPAKMRIRQIHRRRVGLGRTRKLKKIISTYLPTNHSPTEEIQMDDCYSPNKLSSTEKVQMDECYTLRKLSPSEEVHMDDCYNPSNLNTTQKGQMDDCYTLRKLTLTEKAQMDDCYIPRMLDPTEKAQIDDCLLKMITKDFQPFDIVHDVGFRAYSQALNPNYEIPSRKTLACKLLGAKYEDRLNKIKNLINNFCQTICLTVDTWQSRSMEIHLAVTGHFIHTETLEHISLLLECSALEGSSTSTNIAQELMRIADSWEIKSKVNFLVTNNTSNMINAASILGWTHYGCYINKLNLVVQEALNLPKILSMISKVQKTVVHFKRSSQAKEKLLKYQINSQNVSPANAKTVILSVPTRWNSTFLMLQRFSYLQEALRSSMANLNVNFPIITMEEWQCIDEMVVVLKPFYEATVTMSSEKYLTASKALVMTQGLISIYERFVNNEFFTSIKEMAQCLKAGLSSHFRTIEQNETIGLCTYLDPRFKEHAFKNKDALEMLKSVLIENAMEFNRDDDMIDSNTPSEDEELSIWSEFDQKAKSANIPRLAHTKAVEEMEMYLKEGLIQRTDCPQKWWHERRTLYPSLYPLFIRLSNMVVTSMPCEWAFSKSGYIISDRQTRLISSKVNQIMFLHSNEMED